MLLSLCGAKKPALRLLVLSCCSTQLFKSAEVAGAAAARTRLQQTKIRPPFNTTPVAHMAPCLLSLQQRSPHKPTPSGLSALDAAALPGFHTPCLS